MKRMILISLIAGAVLLAVGILYLQLRHSPYLRGNVVESKDGQTYLKIVDDNGGGCGPIYVDGKIWPYAINQEGRIKPGVHMIACGGRVKFEVPQGKVFSFDYWGP